MSNTSRSSSLLKPVLLILGAVFACAWLGACRATEGLGQDIQKVGSKIENEAARHG